MGTGVRISGSLFEGCPTALLSEFKAFHRKNKFVYSLFKQLAFQAIMEGRTRYSQQAIWHILRWNYDIATNAKDYKLSNNYIALYARLAIKEHPKHFGNGFFQLRNFGPRRKENGKAEENYYGSRKTSGSSRRTSHKASKKN